MLKKLSKLLGIALTITLLASLLSLAAPAAAMTAPTVSLSATTISANSTYTLRFDVDKQLTTNGTITVTFPAGTVVPTGAIAGGTIQASDGWVNGNYTGANLTNITFTGSASARTVVIKLNAAIDCIGEGAQVRVVIPAVIQNPPDLGDYTVTVATSAETTALASNSYTIKEPTPSKLPGIVSLYNPSGILINNWTGGTAIQSAINAATVSGSVIKVGAGYYTENPNITTAGLTIQPADGAAMADVVVTGMWTINVANGAVPTVIDGLTLMPAAAGGNIITTPGTDNNTVIQNCSLTSNAGTLGTTATPALINVASAISVKLDGLTIDTTAGTTNDDAIQVNGGVVTINNCQINVNQADNAIDVLAAAKVTVTNNMITGSSGVGYKDSTTTVKTTSTVTGNTFDALQTAIKYNKVAAAGASTLTAKNNTIKNSTIPTGTLATTVPLVAAVDIDVASNQTVVFQKNMVMDNMGYSLVFGNAAGAAANTTTTTIVGNEFSGNAWGLKNLDTSDTLDATLNYWGSDTGPAVTGGTGTGDAVAGSVTYKPWSNTSTDTVVTGQSVATANAIVDASSTVGVTYTADTVTTGISLAKYTGNPTMVSPPAAALAGGYYDVYSPNAAGSITLMFFNSAITADTKVYYFDELQQSWVYCSSQGVASNNAYVYVKVAATQVPTPTNLKGTIFSLVTQKTIPNPPAASSLTPTIGATGVSITPVFTWAPVTGAVRYEITVADEPSFAIPILSNNTNINFYSLSADDALDYDTTYYWEVKAVLANTYTASTPTTASTIGIFTTMAEPTVAEPPTTAPAPIVNVEPTKPEVQVSIPPTKITVEPATGEAIPTYILWIIVVVGAVLIIALIVLIVRTRRA